MITDFRKLVVGMLLGALPIFAGIPVEGGSNTDKHIDVPNPDGAIPVLKAKNKGPLDEVLRFKNGDTLHGNLTGIDQQGKILWTRPDIGAEMSVSIENLRGIRLHRQTSSAPEGARVMLTNDDVLYGTLIKLTEDELTLDTWFGGRLTIPKPMVKSIRPGSKSGAMILSGFGKISDWGHKSGSWKLSRNRLSSTQGQIGRTVELPERAQVHVNVAWAGSYPNFNIVTYATNIKQYYNGCYNLQFNGNYIYLYRGTSNSFGNINYRKLRTKHNVTVDLFIDRKDRKVALMLDRELVKQWNTETYLPEGKGVMLIAQSSYGPTTFSGMRITKWDGRLPNASSSEKAKKEDLVRFSNGDKLSGAVIGIAGGKLTLKTPFATMPVPLSNVVSITLAEDEAERARRNIGDAQFYFVNGDRLTLKLLRVAKGKVHGKSENFGERAFDLRAFVGLKVNVYDEPDETEDSEFEELILGD